MHRFRLGMLIALALPSVAQLDEGQAYFSLRTDRSFAPGEKPVVQLWTGGVQQTLQFRIYRVNDPVKFFLQLGDEHRFGDHVPRPARKLTPLERFHRWKSRTRAWVRNSFRRQFDSGSRASLRNWMAERDQQRVTPSPRPAAEFADVPVLNPQQLVLMWQQTAGVAGKFQNQTVPVNVTGKGLYLLEVTNGRQQAHTIISITNLALIVKGAPGRLLARVVNRETSAPAPDSEVTVRVRNQQPVTQRTDAAGMIDFRVTEPEPEGVLVLARQGADFSVSATYGGSVASSSGSELAGYVYTDRPIYRPGHTVHFKGILRSRSAAGYRIPSYREVQAEVQDSDGKPIFRRALPVSSAGTVNGEVAIPPSAALGYYQIALRAGEAEAGAGFEVEEYRKPEYEVRVTPEKRQVLQGEEIPATIEARYYYGEPVANAKVTWVVHRARYWLPYYERDEEAVSGEGDEDVFANEEVQEETGQLDAQGRRAIRIPTAEAPYDARYRIEARVTDASNREIAGAGWAIATVGSYHVHIDTDQYLFNPGEPIRFNVETRSYDGRPVQAAVRVEVAPSEWNKPLGPVVSQAEGRTDAAGKTRIELTAPAGWYRATVKSRTPEGREVQDYTHLWVTGQVTSRWVMPERIQIVPDKKSYRAGEVARVLIVTGQPQTHLWVTVEGHTVHTSQLVTATGPSAMVEIPVRPEYVPNVYVEAAFIRGGKMFQGSKRLKVPPVEQRLAVQVSSSKSEYKPGESGSFTVEAKDHAGRPVAAEFSLGVVDEAIYAVRRESVEDIVSFFYGDTYNRVNTECSLDYYFDGEAGRRRMQLAQVRPGRGRAQLKPERLAEPKIRKAFPDTIYWVADLRTDAAGRAQAQVTFPDSLTQWRATARGVTTDTRVGSALHRTTVRKNLILSLGTPRFFTEGDEVVIPAIVRNYLAGEKTVRVSLAVKGAEIMEGATRDLKVASRGEAVANFRVRALAPGEAVLLGKALTNEESDALELTLPVLPYGVKLSTARGGAIAGATAETEFDLRFPADAAPGTRAIEIEAAPSIAGAIFGALEYLTSFPYGCTEQTMSSFLPNVLVSQAVKQLGLKSGVDPVQLEKKIRAGLEPLDDFQHQDGGWGWWKDDESDAFMTAYVVAGLARARAAGHRIEDDLISGGAQWLRDWFPKIGRQPADRAAYAAYALALSGEKDRSYAGAVWNRRTELTSYGVALAGLAFQELGDARAGDVAAALEQSAKTSELEAWWPVDRDDLLQIWYDASPEATAHALKFLVKQRPESPLLAKAAFYLVNRRDQGYYWSSTKQTAMVIYGLTDYLGRSGELKPDFSVTIAVNGKPVLSRRFTGADALAPALVPVRLDAAQLAAGANRIKITKSGEGRLYWSAQARYYAPNGPPAPSGERSLNVVREYFRLQKVQEKDKLVWSMRPLEGAVQRGDVLAVRLTVSGSPWRYLMIEDPIPAGTEFIAREDLYEVKDKPPWWATWYTRRDFHDDRAALFQSVFDGKTGTHTYLLKVVNPGQYRVSPARVQPMYQPQYLATGQPARMEVR